MRSKWTTGQRDEFIASHERTIAQYPQVVIDELRDARDAWMPPILTMGDLMEETIQQRKKSKAESKGKRFSKEELDSKQAPKLFDATMNPLPKRY